ncbi:MAG: TonB family protein [Terracidiphilus sp.]|nr:TonB family protein [Terracidiphilus sp.]
MGVTAKFRKGLARFLVLSAVLHLAISACVFMVEHRWKAQVVKVDREQKPITIYPAVLLYAGGTRAPRTEAPDGRKKRPQETKQATDLAINRNLAPAQGQPVAAPDTSVAGSGADRQNADPAFPVFSPHPPVSDRSLLPRSNQEVVVDVKVSAAGDVLEATLVKGIGNGLDQIVLDTVKSWRFHPATINGNPVATEAELVFPFNLNYPVAPS